ncbi:hypothetical protein PIB30_038408 [Stylosanthes scabra]|uniref:Uncharacterized protein n=1 Tax=Stylosanthes scabra TaxID=79078 RepID=A0ABU6TG69_9FABA|nr:hypothetical protein [Stylosanthes scabra]
MTLKRQSFRLRIPWPFAPIGRPSAEPSRRSKDKTKSSKDSDTNVPIQRAPPPLPSPPPPKTPLIEIHEKPTTTSVMIESSVPSPSKSSTPYHTPPPSPSKSSTPFHTPSPSPLPHHSIESSPPKTPPKNMQKLATQETSKPASFSLEQEEEKKDVSEPKESSPSRTIIELPETSIRPNIMSIEPQESQQQESKTEPASNQPPPPPPLPTLAEQTGEALRRDAEERTEEEKEKIVEAVSELEPVPQETETKAKSPLKTVPNSPQISTQPQDFEPQTSLKPSSPISKSEPTFDQPSPSSPLASEHLKPSIEESTLPPLLASQETESKTIPKSPKTSFHHEPTSDQSPHLLSHLPSSSTTQEDKEKMELAASEAQPKEAELKMKSPLNTIPQLPEASSRIENMYEMDRVESKSDSHGAAESSKASLKPQTKLLEPEEKEKEMHKHVKARKSKGIVSNSGTKSNKDPFSEVFRPRRRTHQVVERNLMFATSKFMSSISPEKTALPKGIVCDVSKFVHKLSTVEQSEVVTVSGENRGATMQVGNSAEEAEPEDSTEVITDMEENTEKELAKDDEIGMAYVNSNIQSINNSVMVHGSIT